MNQAGVNKVILYENKSLSIDYDTFLVNTSGEIIEVSNQVRLIINPETININYQLTFLTEDIEQSNIDKINNSIYGWIAKIYFLDKRVRLIEKPFFNLGSNELNTNQSHSRDITITAWNRRGLIAFS